MYFRNKVEQVLYFLSRYLNLVTKNHIIKDNGGKWIFISYLTEPFKRRNEKIYFHGHQNRQETLIFEEVIQELNLSYIFNDYNRPLNFKKRKFDIIFGIEPNFKKMCIKNPKAIKIYYATGAYYKHQNMMIINRTNIFSEKYKMNYPLRRLVKEHDSCEIADFIFQIGSKFTIETYPEHLRSKILLINQTSHVFKNIDIDQKIKTTSKKEFIWFGSSGTILKGLDLVIEYFLSNETYNLHIVGPVEEEFISVFKDKLREARNITLYGFLDVQSKIFLELANKCAFLIFPSGSEGAPGSVINLQKLGVIPITSRWASCDKITDLGYVLKDLNISSIDEAIQWSQSLSKEEMTRYIKDNHNYASYMHNCDRFKSEMKERLSSIISKQLNLPN
jgi:hypothetical protein